ncbi:MAG: tRNA epoxyqueuosine(34) reductase QueG [Acidimicrobiia bacterium]
MSITAEQLAVLRALGEQHGLVAFGVAPADPMERARVALEHRRAHGMHAGMSFTFKNPARSTDARASIPWVASFVAGAVRYNGDDLGEPPEPQSSRPSGRVARYAVGDHYTVLRDALGHLARQLKVWGHKATVVADENNLVDREVAWTAGLGWYGKNANLLVPGVGSWVVLGAVVTSATFSPDVDFVSTPVDDGCGSCTRCLPACPTGAIVEPGVVDGRRCLAWLVQAPGVFPREHRVAMGNRIYGCDDCQEVCPPNRLAVRRGQPRPTGASWVDLIGIVEASDDDLLDRFGHWYLAGRSVRSLRRNALIALGNSGCAANAAVRSAIAGALSNDDEIIRSHALWAAHRLGHFDLVASMVDDQSTLVRDELASRDFSDHDNTGQDPGAISTP